ncbi:hypothetical protein [Mycoplasma procyoni]|uniref:hypothetical protein n=1 Tax=Mycoplasma procyoni TaxID=568784 RepID=UPI00197B34A1|nr:hypothetical protein [Mycoplasma procyoni]MBN3535063.1 hypothetical protein [Mycoplasma procyoni]
MKSTKAKLHKLLLGLSSSVLLIPTVALSCQPSTQKEKTTPPAESQTNPPKDAPSKPGDDKGENPPSDQTQTPPTPPTTGDTSVQPVFPSLGKKQEISLFYKSWYFFITAL